MITIAIPHKGAGLEQVLGRLADAGIVDERSSSFYVGVIQGDKARISYEGEQIRAGSRESHSSNEEVERRLQRIKKTNPLAFGLKVDYDLQRAGQPARIMFKGVETQFNGTPVRVIGRSHYDIPATLYNHEASLAFVGWDELYENLIEALQTKDGRDWSGFNPYLREGSTDIRILGSAGLDDFVGHWVMMHPVLAQRYFSTFPDNLISGGMGAWRGFAYEDSKQNVLLDADCILIDPKYEKIYQELLKSKRIHTKFRATQTPEKAIKGNEGVGIYVVQTGNAVKENGLVIVGDPLVVSETVMAVNKGDFETKPELQRLAKSLNPGRVFDKPRSRAFSAWLRAVQ